MSEVGLGRVKTQRCCDDIEWVFRQATFLIVQASWACSVAIDFGKLFSSSFNFSSFYTARVNRAILSVGRLLPVRPQLRTYRCIALNDAMCRDCCKSLLARWDSNYPTRRCSD